MININNPLSMLLSVYRHLNPVGAEYKGELVGRKGDAASLMIIAGKEVIVYFDESPSSEIVSELLWRLA